MTNTVELKRTQNWGYSIYVWEKFFWDKNLTAVIGPVLDFYRENEVIKRLQKAYDERPENPAFQEILRNMLIEIYDKDVDFDDLYKEWHKAAKSLEDKEVYQEIKFEFEKNQWFLAYWKILNDNALPWENIYSTWERWINESLDNPSKIAKKYKKMITNDEFKSFHFLQDIDQENLNPRQAFKVWEKLIWALENHYSKEDREWNRINKFWDFTAVVLASNITNPIIWQQLSEYAAWVESKLLVKTKMRDAKKSFLKSVVWKRNWIMRKLRNIDMTPTIYDLKKIIHLELMEELEEAWTAQEVVAANCWKQLCCEDASWEFIWEQWEDYLYEFVYDKSNLKFYIDKETAKWVDSYAYKLKENKWKFIEWHIWQKTFESTMLSDITCYRTLRKNPFKELFDEEVIKQII